MAGVDKQAVKGLTTEYAAAGLVFGCLAALILLRRGFRGVSVKSVGSVKIAG